MSQPTIIVSRRARAYGTEHAPDTLSTKSDLKGLSTDHAIVTATLADIGDPKFRTWLYSTLQPRAKRITIELV